MIFRSRLLLLYFILFFAIDSLLPADPVNITFSADKMQGTGAKGKTATALTGNASVTVDSLTIHGERIELYGKDYRYIKASGSVKGEDPEKGFTFSSASLQYDRETEVAEFMGAAQVEDTKNKVETAAERIEYNQKNEIILLQMAVKLKSKDIICDSLFAVYNRNTSMLELTGKPAVKKGKDEFKAARISVNLDTEDIKLEGKVSGSVTEEKEPDQSSKEKEQVQNTDTPPKEKAPDQSADESSKEKEQAQNTDTPSKEKGQVQSTGTFPQQKREGAQAL